MSSSHEIPAAGNGFLKAVKRNQISRRTADLRLDSRKVQSENGNLTVPESKKVSKANEITSKG